MQTALDTTSHRLRAIGRLPPVLAAIELRTESGASAPCGSLRRLSKNEELFAEGDATSFFYKVVSGAVRTCKLLDDGRRQINAFHLAGDIFGLESGAEHRFSAEAAGENTCVLVCRRSAIETEAWTDGAFGRQIISAMMRALERAQDHMLLLGRKSAMEKIATFLLDMADRTEEDGCFDLPMSRSDIADHLGVTIETVSRSLTQLERDGIIGLPERRRTIVLRNKAALQRLGAIQ